MRRPGSVAITGAEGFLGWHLRSRLRALWPDTDVRIVDRAAYADRGELCARLSGAEAVVHLAGANRGTDDAVHSVNVGLARSLVEALEAIGATPYVVYSNTIHCEADTAYGRSKREAAQILMAWASRAGTRVSDLRLPNLFGEGGRPDYNSAVATFCHDLATGRVARVREDGRTELLHAQDACGLVMTALEDRAGGARRVEGRRLAIPDVYARLARLHAGYRGATVPELVDRLDRQLFNTLRAALFPHGYPLALAAHRDDRGSFVELARSSGDTQSSFAVTVPGHTRGNHFHLEKFERFIVVSGRAEIRLRKLFSDTVHVFEVSGYEPVVVDMPALYAHSLTNVGTDDLLTVICAGDHFDAGAPDTYAELVQPMHVGVGA